VEAVSTRPKKRRKALASEARVSLVVIKNDHKPETNAPKTARLAELGKELVDVPIHYLTILYREAWKLLFIAGVIGLEILFEHYVIVGLPIGLQIVYTALVSLISLTTILKTLRHHPLSLEREKTRLR